jgi:hypothetical protein
MSQDFALINYERFSLLSLGLGPYAVRVRLLAASDQVHPAASNDWSVDIYDRLTSGPVAPYPRVGSPLQPVTSADRPGRTHTYLMCSSHPGDDVIHYPTD